MVRDRWSRSRDLSDAVEELAHSADLVAAQRALHRGEDHAPYAQDRLRRAVARAGLPESTVRPAGPMATALAETLAGQLTLLCTEPFARRHGASWAPLGDAALHRGYELRAARRDPEAARVPHWLAALLAAAVGAEPAAPAAGSAGEDGPARLAARG
ncbi:hypothetical protein ACWEQ8_42780, partial [Streptomyces noursei]